VNVNRAIPSGLGSMDQVGVEIELLQDKKRLVIEQDISFELGWFIAFIHPKFGLFPDLMPKASGI
jgi:hypothetical protein